MPLSLAPGHVYHATWVCKLRSLAPGRIRAHSDSRGHEGRVAAVLMTLNLTLTLTLTLTRTLQH